MRFYGFLWIRRFEVVAELGRSLAPIETFARAQLAAIASIFMNFICFLKISWAFKISGHLYEFLGWLAGCGGGRG